MLLLSLKSFCLGKYSYIPLKNNLFMLTYHGFIIILKYIIKELNILF